MSLAASRLSVDILPAGMRQDAWQAGLARIGLRPALSGIDDPGGAISVKPSTTGACLALISGRPQGLAALRTPPAKAPILLLLVLRGRGRVRASHRALELAEGDLCALDTDADWSLDWRTDFDAALLEMPRAAIVARLGRQRIELPVSLGTTVAAAAARPVLRTLASHVDRLEQADLSAGEIAVTELVVSALLAELKAPDGAMTQVQAAHFRRVAAAIDAKLAEPELALADIARQEGMSARYLQRLFERRGQSFSDYVRRQRLERARADLADPNHARESVAAIAGRWGFRDQAHFSRAFSAAFGKAPRQMRQGGDDPGDAHAFRGKPRAAVRAKPLPRAKPVSAAPSCSAPSEATACDHHLPANAATVHWGYLSRALPPVLWVDPGANITVETLTQHAGDDWARLVAGDAGAESVFAWRADGKAVDRRGAGPMNASVFGRGAGEGFGVHVCTGPIHVRGAEPGDVLEIELLDIRPRPCANPAFKGKAFASNASAWWGFQYRDLLDAPARRETVTIYEIDLADPSAARALYSYVWTPQTDPFGVRHETIDYPGVPVDPATIERCEAPLAGIRIPARPHFGFVAVAPREAGIVDSIPPGYFGGNIDNRRAGKGARIYLPVAVAGALLSIGDGHFAQGDGEINGTGLECSLTGDIRIRLHKAGKGCPPWLRGLGTPLIESEGQWVIQAFSYQNYLRELGRDAQSQVYARSTVDLALRNAFRQTRRFLMDVYGLAEDEALSLMSLAVDFGITQVADGNLGVHATIDKAVFAGRAPQP